MSQSFVMTFGKYKGKTLEGVLIEDVPYLDWLQAQPDIGKKFPALIAAMREMGASPDETPVHNAMQALFLEKENCAEVIKSLFNDNVSKVGIDQRSYDVPRHARSLMREKLGVAAICDEGYEMFASTVKRHRECSVRELREWYDEYLQILQLYKAPLECIDVKINNIIIEPSNGADVYFYSDITGTTKADQYEIDTKFRYGVCLELKPRVGDDYPSILRQVDMQRRLSKRFGYPINAFVTIGGKYEGIGANLSQVKRMFKSSDLEFVTLDELELGNISVNI